MENATDNCLKKKDKPFWLISATASTPLGASRLKLSWNSMESVFRTEGRSAKARSFAGGVVVVVFARAMARDRRRRRSRCLMSARWLGGSREESGLKRRTEQ